MNISVVCTSLNDICGTDKTLFYEIGVNITSFIHTENKLSAIRNAMKYAFSTSDGVCVIYSKSSWSHIQKAMLMEFERSSVFVEAQQPYVVAKGFKPVSEGIYFDTVYNKPFVFISNELKEDANTETLKAVLEGKTAIVGIFEEQINNKYTVHTDEVETVMIVPLQELHNVTNTLKKEKIYTTKGESAQKALFNILQNTNYTVATAESCTAGMISSFITDIPGASRYFTGGCVTYSNAFKSRFVGVNSNTLNNFGAVSSEVATQMAVGVLNNSQADFGLAVTGIAGPQGGSKDKPVGLVYISVASRNNVITKKKIFKGNRKIIRHKTAKFALLLLREFILSQ